MQPASGSEFYPARDARTPLTRGFLLGHRHRTQANAQHLPLPNPHTPLILRGTSSNSRRKRSTDSVFLTHQHGDQQENNCIPTSCCQRSHSPLSVDSIAPRVKVRQFSATARSAAGASTPATAPTCCSNTKAPKSRSNPVFKPLRLQSTNVAPPFDDKSRSRSLTSSGPSKSRSHIKVPPVSVRPGKAKVSESNTPDSASPSSLPSSAAPAPVPAVFDVGDANLAPGAVTCTTTYRDRVDSFFDPSSSSSSFLFPSFDALDDLTRWGMDAMTLLSASPDDDFAHDPTNIDQSTTDSNSRNPTFSNPFSTPFIDDDLLENEIPFPSTRPRVVLEPMGVKKSKTLAANKARNLTPSGPAYASNSRSRYPNDPYDLSLPNRPASRPKSPTPPPVLPHPLPPLQSIESPSPLNDDSLARTSSYLQGIAIAESSQLSSASAGSDKRKAVEAEPSPPSRSPDPSSSEQDLNPEIISSAPLSSSDTESGDPKTTLSGRLRRRLTPLFAPLSRKDGEDHPRLRSEDWELSVMFPQTAHYEVWDMSDHGWVSVPALLCLMVKDFKRWAATPLAAPDVSLIELKCDDVPLPVRFTSLCPARKAMPAVIASPSSRPLSPSASCRPNTYLTTFLGGQSALDEGAHPPNGRSKKKRVSMLDAMRKHEEEQKMAKDRISLEGKWTRTFGLPGVGGCDLGRSTVKDTSSGPARGWYLKFWIPIPTRLFLKRETRMFNVHAQIWMLDRNEEKLDRFESEVVGAEGEGTNDGVPSLRARTEMSVSHLRKERNMDGWWW